MPTSKPSGIQEEVQARINKFLGKKLTDFNKRLDLCDKECATLTDTHNQPSNTNSKPCESLETRHALTQSFTFTPAVEVQAFKTNDAKEKAQRLYERVQKHHVEVIKTATDNAFHTFCDQYDPVLLQSVVTTLKKIG